MTGYINLYNPSLRKQRELVSLRQVAVAAGVLMAAMAGWHAYARIHADRVQQQVKAAEAQLKSQRERLAALAKEVSERKPGPALVTQVSQGKALLRARSELADALEGGAFGSTTGFSGYLRAFGRQVVQGLWLTGFDIGGGGADMAINGRTLDPELLPGFIRRLNAEQALKGRSFASLRMQQPEPPPSAAKDEGARPKPAPYIEFALASQPPAASAQEKRP